MTDHSQNQFFCSKEFCLSGVRVERMLVSEDPQSELCFASNHIARMRSLLLLSVHVFLLPVRGDYVETALTRTLAH